MEFRIIGSDDERALTELLANLDTTFFRPHPFMPEEVRRIANHTGRDVYAMLMDGDRPVAYGLLRGWDEGYEVASLGVAVRIDAQRRGFGRLMMSHLHDHVRAQGVGRVRLRVHPANQGARRLYESFGYVYQGEDRGELVMFLDLR